VEAAFLTPRLGDLEGSSTGAVVAQLLQGAVEEDAPRRRARIGRDLDADGQTTPTTEDEFERTRERRRRFSRDLDEASEPSIEKVVEAPVVPEDQTVTVVETDPDLLAITEAPARIDTVVRRPTLGLVGYEDRFCTLEIFGKDANGDGDYVPMYNTSYSAPRHPINSNFLINRISHGTQEAVQIVRTFGDYYLSDVGENPTTVEVEGVLFESKNFPWLSEWRANYDRFLRARQCILRKAMVHLVVDDVMYMGYIIASSVSRNVSPAWELVPFNFTMILRSAVNLRVDELFPSSTEASAALASTVGAQGPNGLLPGNIGDPDASTLAQVAEIVSGSFDEGNRLQQVDGLKFAGSVDEAATRVNIEHLVDVARRINASKGYDFIDLQELRNGYLAQRMAEVESIGLSNPDVLQKLGFPSRYEMAVSARRTRVQEEYRAGIEAGINAARQGLTRWGFL
jgi:hypothetical protein